MEPLIFSISNPLLWDSLEKVELKKSVFVTPTDTVYGLGTLLSNLTGIERILKMKARTEKHFIVLARGIAEVLSLSKLSAAQEIIVKRYWPGAITFILPSLKFPNTTIALRVPKDPFLQKLMAALGEPILSTSCNIHGQETVSSIPEALELFGNQVDLYVDGGPQQNAVASTIVDLTTPTPTLLRKGHIAFP